jgi:hypothetical protein
MKTLQLPVLLVLCTHLSHHALLAFTTTNQEGFTQHRVTLQKPMGIILESDENDASMGVIIKQINPLGNTASACKNNPLGVDICIRDRILQVDNTDVTDKSLEDVMELIVNGPKDVVELVLGRPKDAIVMKWWNGISVAVQPGERIKDISRYEACVKIKYSCQGGGCGTCECSMITTGVGGVGGGGNTAGQEGEGGGGGERYFRPCVARVPKGPNFIWVKPSNRYEPSN